MAIATVTREVYVIDSTNTIPHFMNYIANRFINNLGFVLESSSDNISIAALGNSYSGARRLISYTFNAQPKGKIFLDIQNIYAGVQGQYWGMDVADSVANASLGQTNNRPVLDMDDQFYVTSGEPIIFLSFNHPEVKAVSLTRGYTGSSMTFAILRPSIKPSWWTEDLNTYGFSFFGTRKVNNNTSSYGFYPPDNSLLNSIDYLNINTNYNTVNTVMGANPITSLRSMINGFHLISNESVGNKGGVLGTFSSDVALVNSVGLNPNSIIGVYGTTTRYQTIHLSLNNYSLAIKVAE